MIDKMRLRETDDSSDAKISPEEIFFNEMQKIRSRLLKKEIPEVFPEGVSKILSLPFNNDYYVDRFDFINISSFALISKRWAGPLAEFIGGEKCLEIMAGKGVLSKCLSDFGVKITATDDRSWSWNRTRENTGGRKITDDEFWCDVIEEDCIKAVEKYGGDAGFIICSMPPYKSAGPYHSLIKMREINDRARFIYIGEPRGGMNAENRFFDEAEVIKNDEMFNRAASLYQNWHSMNDKLFLMK